MSPLDRADIERRVRDLEPWYHNLDLRGVPTNPDNPDYPLSRWRLLEPHVAPDLTGKTVLDLGCNAGYFSLRMRERGAEVLGVDWFPEAIEQARFAAQVLGIDVEYRLQNIYEFVLNEDRPFDYVLFLGVFYHLRYPLLILDQLARMTGEMLLFQTVIKEPAEAADLAVPHDLSSADLATILHPAFPRMYFVEQALDGAANNWFICNRSCVEAVLRSSGFANIRHAGEDCWVCAPAEVEQSQRFAHDLTAIRRRA
jgi:tRNA (mo5U34)-methyltransferase